MDNLFVWVAQLLTVNYLSLTVGQLAASIRASRAMKKIEKVLPRQIIPELFAPKVIKSFTCNRPCHCSALIKDQVEQNELLLWLNWRATMQTGIRGRLVKPVTSLRHCRNVFFLFITATTWACWVLIGFAGLYRQLSCPSHNIYFNFWENKKYRKKDLTILDYFSLAFLTFSPNVFNKSSQNIACPVYVASTSHNFLVLNNMHKVYFFLHKAQFIF